MKALKIYLSGCYVASAWTYADAILDLQSNGFRVFCKRDVWYAERDGLTDLLEIS